MPILSEYAADLSLMKYATRSTSSSNRGDRYKEMEVLSATPAGLVVIVYDHLLSSLMRARKAIISGDIETRATNLARARDAVGELLATLDRERGGDVAGHLGGLYAFFLSELVALGLEPAVQRLDRVTAMVSELHQAFVGIQDGAAR